MANDEKFPWEEDAAAPATPAATATTEPAPKAKKGKAGEKATGKASAPSAPPPPPPKAPPPPDRDTLDLPDSAALDAILDEQLAFDRAVEEDAGGEFYSGEMGKTGLEQRAEVPALALLHHERRVLARALAPVAALFEGGQTPLVESKRKQHRQIIATLIASEQQITGDKIESMLERLANSDERHITFCEELERLRVRYYLGRVALMEKIEEIRDREESLRTYNAEIRAGLHGAGQV